MLARRPLIITVTTLALTTLGASAWHWRASAADARAARAQASLLRAPADVATPGPDAEQHPSGTRSRVLVPGHGLDLPGLDDLVTVHFTTWSRAGQLFGDSRDNGVPETLPTARMRPGLSEVVQRMHVGEQRRIWVPAHASVFVPDDDDDPPPRMADLTVDLELVALRKAPVQAALQPPAGASSTTSGLQYMFLKRGSDARVPELTDTILYKHSGWRANGRLVESSVLEGKGQTSVVFQMLPGLREGVRLMRVGDRAVFWVPANLAYGERPKRRVPRGPLVFELELLAIE